MGTVVSLRKAQADRALRCKRALVEGRVSAGGVAQWQRLQAQALQAQDHAAALRTAQQALQEAGQAQDATALAEVHRTLAVLAVGREDWPTAAMHAVAALQLGSQHGAACHLIAGLHQVQARESAPQAMQQFRAAFMAAEAAGDDNMQRLALAGLAIHCLVRRHHAVARLFLARLARLLLAGDLRWRACSLALSAWAARPLGGLPPALADEAATLALSSTDAMTAFLARWALVEHYTGTGQGEAAAECHRHAQWQLAACLSSAGRQAPAFHDVLPVSVLSFAVTVGRTRMAEIARAADQPETAMGGR